jgi:hypothetical protein
MQHMRRNLFRITILGFFILSGPAYSRNVILTFGPMLHFNWGNGGNRVSYGFEASLWTPTGLLPQIFSDDDEPPMIGADFGLEFEGGKVRMYSEAQYGFYFGGSAGPYLEFAEGHPVAYGLQGSVWGALLVGTDFRMRYGTKGFAFSPGIFAKGAFCPVGCEL